MANEEAAILQKVRLKEPAVKKVVQKARLFRSALLSGADVDFAHEDLLQALEQLEFSATKLQALARTFARESRAYLDLSEKKASQVDAVQAEIRKRVADLENERTMRNNKEEYLALAKLIQQYPSRAEIEATVAQLESELAALDAVGVELTQRRNLRERQFAVLLAALGDLQRELDAAAAADDAATAAAAAATTTTTTTAPATTAASSNAMAN